ncbi:MAG: hypothetical protein FJX75_07485 [Armatimonadetes bacterium]|nr:hypothetical protein [Armatimonadota bacterium]
MADPYPSFNLQMVNLFIGMCRGEPSLPRALVELGYQDGWVEFRFTAAAGEVRPELIMWSQQERHTVLWEWKSGGHIDLEQMGRYAAVTADDLRDRAFAPSSAWEHHDLGVVVPERKATDAARVLAEVGFGFPLISRDAAGLRLAAHAFGVQGLNAAFTPSMAVDFDRLPLGFVPFDRDSPDWAIAVVEYMHQRQPRVLAEALAREVVPAWNAIGADRQSEYVKRMASILREMSAREFHHHLRRASHLDGRTHTPTWEVTNNPLESGTDRRSAAFRDIQKRAMRLVERLRHGQGVLPGTDE